MSAPQVAYESFLTDVSGLDDDFQQHWLASLVDVAVPSLVNDSARAASTLEKAGEHGVGTLMDSHFAMVVRGTVATVTDCLDEYHWYVVSDSTGQVDPGVARGYYVSSGTVALEHGFWVVTTWTAGSKPCQF